MLKLCPFSQRIRCGASHFSGSSPFTICNSGMKRNILFTLYLILTYFHLPELLSHIVDATHLSKSLWFTRGQPSINLTHIGASGRSDARSSFKRPSCGKLQAGYRIARSRVRISLCYRLVSVTDKPYSDSFEDIVSGDFYPCFVSIVTFID